jgi:hypothetical protein
MINKSYKNSRSINQHHKRFLKGFYTLKKKINTIIKIEEKLSLIRQVERMRSMEVSNSTKITKLQE